MNIEFTFIRFFFDAWMYGTHIRINIKLDIIHSNIQLSIFEIEKQELDRIIKSHVVRINVIILCYFKG